MGEINDIDMTNLSFLERQGLQFCLRMKNNGTMYFNQADNGCSILIRNPADMEHVILEGLLDVSKFQCITSDPREEYKKKIKRFCSELVGYSGL